MSNHDLNRTNVEKLIKALRSGKYKQTREKLRAIANGKPEYCLLGLANEISKTGYWVDSKEGGTYIDSKESDDMGLCTMSCGAARHYGFDHYNPKFDYDTGNKHLEPVSAVDLNDLYELSFTEFADILERELNG